MAHGLSCSEACGIFLDQAQTRVPCIGRRILNHCATREAPEFLYESLWSTFFKYLPSSTSGSTLYLTFTGKKKKNVVQYYVNISFTSGNRISYTEAEKRIYKIPKLRFQGYACLTNLPSDTAFRGFGFPQGTLVTESCITAVAAKCGLPPEKVRL